MRKLESLFSPPVLIIRSGSGLPSVYKSFDLSTNLLSKVSASVLSKAPVETAAAEEDAEMDTAAGTETKAGADPSTLFEDSRDLTTLHQRLAIFKSAFITIAREPARLLRGCAGENVMSIAHPFLTANGYNKNLPWHMHNSYLEAMVLTGLPGLAITILFSLLLVGRMIRVFFSADPRLGMAVKVLTIPLTGFFIYSMMESEIFFNTEFTALFFYLLAGMLLAWSYEVLPPKKKGKADDTANDL